MLAAVDSVITLGAGNTRMIVTCPHCATRYRIAEEKLPAGGRIVRCNKCRHAWVQQLDAVELAGERIIEVKSGPSLSEASSERARFVRPKGQALALLAAFLGLAAVVALLVCGLVHYRGVVVRVWPQAETLYRAIGISPKAEGGVTLKR